MNPKKILIFSTAYYPFVGGVEVSVKEITDRIPGIQFDLITARLDSKVSKAAFDIPERVGNVNVYRVGFGFKTLDKILLPFWGAFRAIKLDNKNHYDFYWCIMATFASGAAYIANILKFWRSAPIILTLQEGDSEEHFKYRWFGLINLSWKLALRNTNKLTALSNFLAERARRFGFKGEIKIIPNGVDINKFEIRNSKSEIEERKKIRQELELKESDVVLVTSSRLVKKNGVGDVILALTKLPENIKFIIFGEGELKESLKLLAKSLEVSERVIFKGYVSHENLPKYLKACDIFIRPSLSEGFGNSFIEAMACKIPVIATPVGGIPDFIFDPSNTSGQVATGYYCEPENPESVANTIQKVISDPNKNEIIENAYNMVKEKYDWDLIAKQMSVVFNK